MPQANDPQVNDANSLTSHERMARALCGEPTGRPALAYLFLGGARHVLEHAGLRMNQAHADASPTIHPGPKAIPSLEPGRFQGRGRFLALSTTKFGRHDEFIHKIY